MVALRRYEAPACASCGVFAPECLVPIGDGEKAMCWICAHAVTEHGAEVGAPVVDCGCSADAIYPPQVLALRGLRAIEPEPEPLLCTGRTSYADVVNDAPRAPRLSQMPARTGGAKRWSHLAAARASSKRR